jgi:hypothetical protein
MRTTFDPQARSWLAAQLRWERLLDELRRTAHQPAATPVAAVERPQAA